MPEGAMFVHETESKAARKADWLMAVIIAILCGPYVLLTMHWHRKPSRRMPPGFRLFGFPRPTKVD
jgi:hypothetical protein